MRITLKLYATLSDLLPPDAQQNAIEVDVPEGTTPAQLIERYRVPEKLAHLVLRNGVYLSAEARSSSCIVANDVIAIWPPVAGG